MLYFFSFILFSALVLVSVFVGIIVTGMQDATERIRVETERRKRTNLTKKYFALTDEEVTAMSKMFGVLDADGDQEIVISELHRAMEGLQVRHMPGFLHKAIAVFSEEGKDDLDEADFLLLVMLCKRAIEVELKGGAELTQQLPSHNSFQIAALMKSMGSDGETAKSGKGDFSSSRSMIKFEKRLTGFMGTRSSILTI
mmetsp:Transcript_22208/g.35865  ORF Transcript_22208/g.35865 Transcript_22208/m.35865 type:complete len:198 (-) Transcript_22208:180-773(-)